MGALSVFTVAGSTAGSRTLLPPSDDTGTGLMEPPRRQLGSVGGPILTGSPLVRNRQFRRLCVVVLSALAVAGCGGGSKSDAFTETTVADTMTEAIRDTLPEGTTMDPLECVEDGDALHYRCLSTTRSGDRTQPLVVSVTCSMETMRCISAPE